MFRRLGRLTPLLAALLGVLAAPASAQQTGGTEYGAQPANRSQVVTVSDGAFTLAARSDALLGRIAAFRGRVPAEHAGRTLTVERLDPRTAAWTETARTTVGRDGAFTARWKTHTIGRFRIRARVDTGGATAASASPELAITVYKPAVSTWYGPGFYGRRTACGQRMSRTLIGVAHKTLPCGTAVALLYKGRTIVAPVVDRGPYRPGTSWDLTAAAAQALGFTHTDTLGAVRLREPAPAAARR